jgi:hypothetical protein
MFKVEDGMGKIYSTHGTEEECIQGSGEKSRKKEAPRKT